MSRQQYGFVKDRSTSVCLRKDVGAMDCVYIVAIAVNIEGAFGNLWWPSDYRQLSKAGVREILVQLESGRYTRMMKSGCIKGSNLGPLL